MVRAFDFCPDGLKYRGLFQNHMGICAANAKGTYSGPTGIPIRFPGGKFGINVEGAIGEVKLGIRAFEVQAGDKQLVLKHQNCLN